MSERQATGQREKLWLAVIVYRWIALFATSVPLFVQSYEPRRLSFDYLVIAAAVLYTTLITYYRRELFRLFAVRGLWLLTVDVAFSLGLLASDSQWYLYSISPGLVADLIFGLGVALAVSLLGSMTYTMVLVYEGRFTYMLFRQTAAFVAHLTTYPAWSLLFAYPHRLAEKLERTLNELVENKGKPSAANGTIYESLTSREREMLSLIAAGFSNKDIAFRVDISLETVKTHIKHLFKKLNVNSRTQAVFWLRSVDPSAFDPEGYSPLKTEEYIAITYPFE